MQVQTGFKEWSLVCDNLIAGRQSLILRKGGIHEGKSGFRFEHDAFWLFPTFFHAQAELLHLDGPPPPPVPKEEDREEVVIRGFARLEWVRQLTDWETVEALAPFHCWNEDIIRERFDYEEDSRLHAAWVRVYSLPDPWVFPYEKRYGGCRSWVKLPDEGAALMEQLRPVLDDETAAEREKDVVQRFKISRVQG